ncbi:MAG: right-handed parallel beta-helix repeat-containing protein [Bacteroidales bacterium]|jgi:hypothetical protein|nr:right-handed parallel beta-helix repeat-containing protein [Bacteroidales bacterium]
MKLLPFYALVFFLSFINITTVSSTVRYVKAGATGNGSSWTNASGDLQAMINGSTDGDQIWITSGTYTPVIQANNTNGTPGNRNNTFIISKNIRIYGGFAGYEINPEGRDHKKNLTILNGNTDNSSSYHVLIFSNGCEALLDGLTITGGNANGKESVFIDGKEYRQDAGGGIYIMRSSPRLNNIIVKNNSAVYGGGIYSFHSFPVLTNVTVNHNSADQGGGIYHYYSFPVIVNITVSQNSGGGIFNVVSNPEISNSVIWGNENDLHNDAFSHTHCSYSLIQNETKDTEAVVPDDKEPEENVGRIIYVAPDGNDGNTGSEDSPLATIAGARNNIRKIKATGLPAGGIIVYFRGGTYPITETTYLTNEDSGTDASPVIYKAYPGETPVFTGGYHIQGSKFEKVKDATMRERLTPEARNKVVCYNLYKNGFSLNDLDYSKDFWKKDNLKEHVTEEFYDNNNYVRRMQVFMDDEALYLARYPNKTAGIFPENPYNTYLSISEIYGGRGAPGETWDGKSPVFRIDEPRMKSWKSYEDIIVFGMLGYHYENERNLVKEINTQQMTVELQSMPTYGLFDDARVAFENVFEELDQPGEYYIDKNTGVLYLYPVKDLNDTEVKIAALDKNFMIDVKGASNITFSGLTFELTKGSVFYIRGGRNCTVENCNLKNFGIWGVRLGDNALTTRNFIEAQKENKFSEYLRVIPASDNGYNHKVTGCYFLNTGHHACRIASGNAGNRERGNMIFENNIIKYSGLIGSTYRSGLNLHGAGILVKNNTFLYCLGQAITGNIIDTEIINNEFCDSPCDMGEDTGTLYLNYLATNDGVKVRYNFFHDVTNMDNRYGRKFGHALRSVIGYDNTAPFRDFSYNVVYNYPTAGLISIVTPWTCINNVFVDCDVVLPYYPEFFNTYKGRTPMDLLTENSESSISALYTSGLYRTTLWQEKYPELYAYYEYMANEKEDLQQPMDQIYNNLIVNINKIFQDRNSSLEELQLPAEVSVDPRYGNISNNHYLTHDPGFPGVANRNFQLSREVTNRYGMEWIDMSTMGAEKSKKDNSVLPVTSARVHNDSELREALADGSIDAIIFANDITVYRSDLVIQPRRAKPDLVIDGNGYTLTELMVKRSDPAKVIRLESNGTIRSLTVRSMTINGRNGAGNIYISAPEKVDLIYRNVHYKGPKLAENAAGSILLDNSEIRISFAEEGGTFMGEAVKANQIRFRDVVNITKDYDSDGTMEAVLKLTGSEPSLIVETFPRQTEVMIDYAGQETAKDRFTGGGGAINADHPFDFVIESKAAIRYKGVREYLSGAKPKKVIENSNSSISILIYEDAQKGVADKILSVEGDVIIGVNSSVDIDVRGTSQCLLEVNGNLSAMPGSSLSLSGYKFDSTIPGIVTKYPVLLMKGGASSNITFDRPSRVSIQSQQTQQDWMRSIGFVSDGTMKFTAHQISLTKRTSGNELYYEAENGGLITVETRIKGGANGVTQSLSYTTENNAPVNGGSLTKENVDMKNITRFYLASDKNRIDIDSEDDATDNQKSAGTEEYGPGIGNLNKYKDPLFQDFPTGNFQLKEGSPLINVGNNQKYLDAISLFMNEEEKKQASKARIIGGIIDIGAYESDTPADGNTVTGEIDITDLPDDIAIWSKYGKLYIQPEMSVKLFVYTVTGLLVKVLDMKENETAVLSLSTGVYLVASKDHKTRKAVVY